MFNSGKKPAQFLFVDYFQISNNSLVTPFGYKYLCNVHRIFFIPPSLVLQD